MTHFNRVVSTLATVKGGHVDFFKGESKSNVIHSSQALFWPSSKTTKQNNMIKSTVLGKFEQFPVLRYAKGTLSVAESQSHRASPISSWSWSQ